MQRDFLGPPLADVHKRAWRKAGFLGALLNQFHRRLGVFQRPEQACTQVRPGGQGESGTRQVRLFRYSQTCYPEAMERELALLTSAMREAGKRAMDLALKGF